MTIAEFRKNVKASYPHIKVSVKTVSFADLARAERKCLTITGDRNREELAQVNAWAKEAGILPDGSIRFYKEVA